MQSEVGEPEPVPIPFLFGQGWALTATGDLVNTRVDPTAGPWQLYVRHRDGSRTEIATSPNAFSVTSTGTDARWTTSGGISGAPQR
jgi:hypothetical protein